MTFAWYGTWQLNPLYLHCDKYSSTSLKRHQSQRESARRSEKRPNKLFIKTDALLLFFCLKDKVYFLHTMQDSANVAYEVLIPQRHRHSVRRESCLCVWCTILTGDDPGKTLLFFWKAPQFIHKTSSISIYTSTQINICNLRYNVQQSVEGTSWSRLSYPFSIFV